MRRHVTQALSAYCHGQLGPEAHRRVAEHVIGCPSCHAALDEVRRGIAALEALPRVPAPAASRNAAFAAFEEHVRDGGAPEWRARRRSLLLAAAAVALPVAALGVLAHLAFGPRSSWTVVALEGAPRSGARPVASEARLEVGEWLETDAASRARLEVPRLGEVELGPASRLRIVTSELTEQRLHLAHGTLSARIWAPPRLFFVETATATAVDLGCAYTLDVDREGSGLLRVTSGFVALEQGRRESLVPAGAECALHARTGPGTPYFEDASPLLVGALARLDEGEATDGDVAAVVTTARPRDALTLFHSLHRLHGAAREAVLDRLITFDPLPGGVTRDGILRLDEGELARWRHELRSSWY
jgi:anti-sigma factor RsiW